MYLFYYLGKNHIGDIGCERLSKLNWPNIKTLNLGNSFIIKGRIRLVTVDAST